MNYHLFRPNGAVQADEDENDSNDDSGTFNWGEAFQELNSIAVLNCKNWS